MTHKILANGNLEISVDIPEQQSLKFEQENNPSFPSDDFMYDLLEPLTCNSELEWIQPEEISALTSAPILGTRNDIGTSQDNVDKVWWFPNYAVRNVQQDLADYGVAIFQRVG